MKLSKNQWKIVRHGGNLLVISVPGAGKTRIVQMKAIQEAAKLTALPFRVACLTYTNAAAAELSRRILPSLREEARDRIYIGTLHSFCINEILIPNANRLEALSRGCAVATPEHPVAEKIIEDILGRAPTPTEVDRFGDIRRSKDGSPQGAPEWRSQLETYLTRLLEQGLIDFSGVLYYSELLLARHPDVTETIAKSFTWFLIDEYQDTSVAQLEILRRIAHRDVNRWMLIGDFNQSIFGFNGVDRRLLAEFAECVGCKGVTLRTTYRCRRVIAWHATNLIREPALVAASGDTPGEALTFEGTIDDTVDSFIRGLGERNIAPSEAAIVAPARWALRKACARLDVRRIPWSPQFRFSGHTAVLDCISALLACVLHPEANEHVGEAFDRTQAIIRSAGLPLDDVELRLAVLQIVAELRGMDIYKLSVDEVGALVLGTLSKTVPKSIAIRLSSAFGVALRPGLRKPDEKIVWKCGPIARMTCRHESVCVATIHGAKGLEFRGVLLPAFEVNTIPHGGATDPAEELRKAYVAVTRSSEFLVYGYQKGRASAYLHRAFGVA